MAPATGRPSSSVAHRSDHATPGAAATHSTMSELATPVQQCPAGTVNQPTANNARVRWWRNQQTLQWLDKRTIRMQLDSSRDSLLGKDFAVHRGRNTFLTTSIFT
ncbi:regulator of sigma E protease [Trypanosoma cruzi]|nr:regulator of sigma E protease [Trypanosoma cruzi]